MDNSYLYVCGELVDDTVNLFLQSFNLAMDVDAKLEFSDPEVITRRGLQFVDIDNEVSETERQVCGPFSLLHFPTEESGVFGQLPEERNLDGVQWSNHETTSPRTPSTFSLRQY